MEPQEERVNGRAKDVVAGGVTHLLLSPPSSCRIFGQQCHTMANCGQLKDVMMVGRNMNGLSARPDAQLPSSGCPIV